MSTNSFAAAQIEPAPPARLGTGLRLFLTGWLIFSLHFATNIVREHYPAFSLAERGTLRVDPYLGLHPDLFEIPGRGAFINNNPGASLIAALPYAVTRPLIDRVVDRVQARRASAGTPLSADYDDPRPNRKKFFAQVRERGLDVRFGLAALVIHLFATAPFSAAMLVVMRRWLRRAGLRAHASTALALLYGFGTPIFFRSGFLNQNLFVAHFTLLAVALLPLAHERDATTLRRALAGACAGAAVLCDYSGIVGLLAIGLFALAQHTARSGRFVLGCRDTLPVAAGAIPPLAVLLGYQALAFGHPFLPAQHFMPPTEFSVSGWNGFALPAADLLLQNLFDPRFGLFAFCPLLALAFAAPLPSTRRPRLASRPLLVLGIAYFVGLLLFSSANQFARLQWNTGVRYLVPAVPLLFLPLADVLLRLPRQLAWLLGVLAVAHASVLAMVREDVPTSWLTVATSGLQLPALTVVGKMRGQYVESFAGGAPDPLPLFLLALAVIAVIWSPAGHRRPGRTAAPR